MSIKNIAAAILVLLSLVLFDVGSKDSINTSSMLCYVDNVNNEDVSVSEYRFESSTSSLPRDIFRSDSLINISNSFRSPVKGGDFSYSNLDGLKRNFPSKTFAYSQNDCSSVLESSDIILLYCNIRI